MIPFFYAMPILQLKQSSISFKSIRVENPFTEDFLVLFLHEALGSINQWKTFPELVCKKLNLNGFVYERQGHGDSSPLVNERKSDYLHEAAWIELPEIIDQILPQNKKVILVGHSDGGTIALLYAAKFPKRVFSCVTMAAHVINEPETIVGIEPAINAFKQGKLKGLEKYHGNKTEMLFYAWANTWRNPFFENWNICSDIKSINCPTLAFQGELDQYGTLKQLELIQSSIRENVQIRILSNCGHQPQFEQTSIVINEIAHWLKSIIKNS
jgi:pimeloyl-ACP methyl ester carboxylesterase